MSDSHSMLNIPILEHDRVSRYLESLQYNLFSFGSWQQQEPGQCYENVLGHFKFIYIAQGSCKLVVNGTAYFPQGGDILMFAPFVPYRAICLEDEVSLKFYYLHFDVDPAEKRSLLTLLLGLKDIAFYQGLMSAPFIGDIEAVHQYVAAKQSGAYYYALNLLNSTIMSALSVSVPQRLLGLANENAATNEELLIRSCVAYIDAHFHEPILVEDLCRHTNVSQSYLYKCFSEVLNVSTKDFIMEYKLRYLTVDLLKEEVSLKELAYNYGFSSVGHLSTVFKKYYGCPPTVYRKAHLQSGADSHTRQ